MEKIAKEIAQNIKEKLNFKPKIAIILGSGLSGITDKIEDKVEIEYSDLSNMPKTTVKGHHNKFVCGRLNGQYVIAMLGRFHYYDCGNVSKVALPIYIFKELGVETLIVTNSAGAVNKSYSVGDLVIIKDHINFTGQNPLIANFNGEFVDMTEPYSYEYITKFEQIAKQNDIDLKQGVYMQFSGPSYETKAEIIMADKIGADLVGMSTALEVIVANSCKLKVLGVSLVTNMATGIAKELMSHNDVLKQGKMGANKLVNLLKQFVANI